MTDQYYYNTTNIYYDCPQFVEVACSGFRALAGFTDIVARYNAKPTCERQR